MSQVNLHTAAAFKGMRKLAVGRLTSLYSSPSRYKISFSWTGAQGLTHNRSIFLCSPAAVYLQIMEKLLDKERKHLSGYVAVKGAVSYFLFMDYQLMPKGKRR